MKNRELEIKVLNIDLNDYEKKIIELGGVLIDDLYQENLIFDREKFLEKKNSYLRLRREKSKITGEEKSFLTYKEVLSQDLLRDNLEINTIIDDLENCKLILEKLDYSLVTKGTKYRKSYYLSGARIDLDIWDKETLNIPYMEIEVEDELMLNKIINLLDIENDKISTKTIRDLQKEFRV